MINSFHAYLIKGFVSPSIDGQQMTNYGHGHVDWCMSHYRSYDRSTDSWLGNDGQRRRCISSN